MRETLPEETVSTTDARGPGRSAAETRSFAPANSNSRPAASAPELSVAETSALGMLRCGRSFAEAAESCGLDVRRVMQLWSAAG
jgi:hypothetical protein